MRTNLIAALMMAAGASALAVDPSTSVTIYSSAEPGAISPDLYRPVPGQQQWYQPQPIPGYAVIREDRPMNLAAGVGQIKFTDVAALIDPTTVRFTCLSDPSAAVLEQNYQFDLVSSDKLLQRFIDQEINATVVRGDHSEIVRGTLLSSAPGSLILRGEDGLQIINGYQGISLSSLPQDLITRPTLVWDVKSAKGGTQVCRVSYETAGITWWADYNLVYTDGKTANSGTLDVNAWVSILNQSGGGYDDATFKLIAGSVNRAPRQNVYGMNSYPRSEVAAMGGEERLGFQEKSFFEYHLYTLGRPANIPNNSTKQLELFTPARNVPCEKIIVYDGLRDFWWGDGLANDRNLGTQSIKDVDIYLKFVNGKAGGMGMPLPAGRIRVSKVDPADSSMEFIGEDVIRHTPRDETVLVKLGKAFDVVGERTQTDFKEGSRFAEETIEIKVRNRKEEAVDVIVQERMYRWSAWEIKNENHHHVKIDSRRVHFPLPLKPGEEGVVKYTVRYEW